MKSLRLEIALIVVGCISSSVAADQPILPLKAQVARADAIVVGLIGEIESKRLGVTIFARGSDGKQPQVTTLYDLAVVHPEMVLKKDSEDMVNRADKSNPLPWLHMACRTPGQDTPFDSALPSVKKGERQVWFMRRDTVMTGHYFISHKEQITDDRLQELKGLVAEAR